MKLQATEFALVPRYDLPAAAHGFESRGRGLKSRISGNVLLFCCRFLNPLCCLRALSF
jgi:hypothetical protein